MLIEDSIDCIEMVESRSGSGSLSGEWYRHYQFFLLFFDIWVVSMLSISNNP
jgi:hypothetical protein